MHAAARSALVDHSGTPESDLEVSLFSIGGQTQRPGYSSCQDHLSHYICNNAVVGWSERHGLTRACIFLAENKLPYYVCMYITSSP